MQDIDFLPRQYRQQHLRRRSQPWQAVVVLAFGALMAGTGVAQHRQRARIEAELEVIEPRYQTALEQKDRLTEIQGRLADVRSEAELLAYLRHPWPRTQLLAAIVAPLPDEITLGQILIHRAASQRQSVERRTRAEVQDEQPDRASLPPAARDLDELRDELDGVRTVVTLSGTARQSAPLHRYLGKLTEHALIAKTRSEAIENVEGAEGPTLRFEAALLVRPGYGQPGGPTPEESEKSAPADEPTALEASASKPLVAKPDHVTLTDTPGGRP